MIKESYEKGFKRGFANQHLGRSINHNNLVDRAEWLGFRAGKSALLAMQDAIADLEIEKRYQEKQKGEGDDN